MPSSALQPRPQTFDVLAKTRNVEAATALLSGLSSPSHEIRAQCVKILLGRTELAARAAIVSQWAKLDATTRQSLAGNKFELQPACLQLIQTGTPAEKQAAITVVCDLDMTAALPDMIALSLEKRNPLCDVAMKALTELCERWGSRARSGRDVPSVRTAMIDAMARVIYEYPMHKNDQLVDAWLMLVSWEDSAHRAIVNDPVHPAFRAVQNRFWSSQHPAILQLLGGYLWRGSTPKSILTTICERPEPALAVKIAEMLDDKLLTATLKRMHDMAPLVSLDGLALHPAGVTPAVHRRLWLMLAANSPSLEPVLAGAVAMSKSGSAEGRRTAADIIRNCRRKEIDVLAQYIQQASADLSDDRSLGANLLAVLNWVGGASTVLDTAAREFFNECTLDRLLDVVRKWPAPLCRAMAQVVSRLEPEVVPQLLKELKSPAPRRRIMAVQVIRLLDVSAEIAERLLPLVKDPRIEVRVPVIDLLAALGSRDLVGMLPELLDDATTDVQDAAQRAKRRLMRRFKVASATDPHPAKQPQCIVPATVTKTTSLDSNEAARC